MGDFTGLSNHFLIAMPALADPNFYRTVTLVCEHSTEGAMGIVINRTTDLALGDILQQMGIEAKDADSRDMTVHLGGPVQTNRGFVLHEPLGKWESTLPITDTLGVSTSRDILTAIAENRGPERCLVALGYAGWGAGQLERELAENSWLNGPSDRQIIFDMPIDSRWQRAATLVGVDLSTISGEAGHA
ncbi:MAG: YqgE/AlgH family protein [Acidiferrobacterales bacterium]